MEKNGSGLIRLGEISIRFFVDETQSAGKMVVFEFAIPSRARVPVPHYHRDVDEVIYGLEGTMTTTVDGKPREVKPGETAFIPRGIVHHHANAHEGTARALCVMSPGSIGRRFFEEMATVVNVPGRPDLERAKEVMLRHGLVPA